MTEYLDRSRQHERINILQNMLMQYHAQMERETRDEAVVALKASIVQMQNALALETRGIPATLDGKAVPNCEYR